MSNAKRASGPIVEPVVHHAAEAVASPRASRRGLLKGSGAGAALALLGGAVGAPRVAGAQAPTVKIGSIGPLTGALAYNGNQAKAGIQYAVDDINAKGGIKSLGGAKLEVIYTDAESRPDVAAAQVDKLAEAGVSCLVGCQASSLTLATTQAAARYKLPQVIDVGTAEQIVERGLPNVFRFSPGVVRSVEQGIVNLDTINKNSGKKVKTVAVVHEEGPFGSGMAKILKEKLPGIGLEVIETISHPTPQRDFNNIVLRLKAVKPDLVMPSHYINEFILFARTMRQQRFSPKAMYSIYGGGASNIRFVREHNEAAQYIIDTNHWYDPRRELSKSVAKRAADAKLDLTYDIMVAYGATQLIGDALERAKSSDRERLIETLATETFNETIMPYGPIKFVKGDNTGSRLVNTQIRGDKIEVIFPKEFATIEPVFPMPGRI
ncbi:MAG: ABC transporter substrate-binding protein [Lautropia sp.]